jgi:hypothetical protein
MQFDTVKAGVHFMPRSRRQIVLAPRYKLV